MATSVNFNLTITPTLLKVLQNVSPKDLDKALCEAFPGIVDTAGEEELMKRKLDFVNRLRNMALPTPKTGIDEAMRDIRDADFLNDAV